ncbi:hypothetical protein Pla110_26170 [Polystyrenella longa]|uniref:Uncharacterized protein n=1 Tax=Polystyrenella longa TaxID=2528007 RepID=A0A518CNS5_9PLAN|nr:hypothetical protein [Polystyrenella longa]QDU80881.1 hypothetical protein Pla110_26170 [Polystyrenella longa]
MLERSRQNPLFHPIAILMAGLALSIGWGIRGNYGHETGAMMPGLLTGIVVCLFSQREDWRERVAYFALFGALGWGFGGSMSYMQILGFTHSGHFPSQIYGFYMLFFLGFLWACLGGAGTAIPAVYSRKELTDLCKPLGFLVGVWIIIFLYRVPLQTSIQDLLHEPDVQDAMSRHAYAVYWLDSDWLQVLFVIGSLLAFDFFNKRYEKGFLIPLCAAGFAILGTLVASVIQFFLTDAIDSWNLNLSQYFYFSPKFLGAVLGAVVGINLFHRRVGIQKKENVEGAWILATFLLMGLVVGGVLQAFSDASGLSDAFARVLVRYFGDQSQYDLDELIFNWPNFTLYVRDYLGLIFGAMVGIGIYFYKYGEFAFGSKLFLYMACGWFAGFLFFPVILDLRLTPPRGDNWAGILGTYAGAVIYFLRHQKKEIVTASVICGMIGGIGFSGIAWLKLMLVSIGSPKLATLPGWAETWTEWQKTADRTQPTLTPSPEYQAYYENVVQPYLQSWQHWQHQNWHSFLEQSYGFVNGVGVIIAMAILLPRVAPLNNSSPRKRWTEILALMVSVAAVTYLNLRKNISGWVRDEIMEPEMKAPWFESISFSADGWFLFFYLFGSLAFLYLLLQHKKQRIPIVPSTWLGRGQLLFVITCWILVSANVSHALPGFRDQRLLTEGIITINAIILTVFLLTVRRESLFINPQQAIETNWSNLLCKSVFVCVVVAALLPLFETATIRMVYGDAHAGHSGENFRFGPKADWKHKPNLKSEKHQ